LGGGSVSRFSRQLSKTWLEHHDNDDDGDEERLDVSEGAQRLRLGHCLG